MATSTITRETYKIIYDSFEAGFVVEGPDGMLLRDKNGSIRVFSSRNAARKRISREKSGNFHA